MKILSRILAVLIIVSTLLTFSACGGDDTVATTAQNKTTKATENSTSPTTSNTAATTENKKTTVKTTAKVVSSITNLAGYNTIGNLIARTTNKKGNPTDSFVKSLKGFSVTLMQAWEPHKSGKIFESTKWCLEQVQKEFGVTVKYDGYFTNYNENLTANLTANSAKAQVYMCQDFNFASYFKNGYLCDLTTAMSKSGVDFKEPWFNKNAKEFLNINYKQYGWITFGAEYTFPYGILYNKDLVKKAKLTDIESLVKNGKWTWATLEKYAKKLDSSQITGFGTGNITQMLGSMVATKGSTLVTVKKGQSPNTNINTQTNLDCLTQLTKWCGNNGICDSFSNKDWTYPKTQFAAGKIAMLYGSHDAIKQILVNKKFDDSIGFVPFPTEKGTKKYTNVCIPQFVWFIPAQHKKNADKILFIANELYRQEYRFAQRNFEINWKTYFDDADTVDMECNMMYGRDMFTNVYDWRSVSENNKTGNTTTATIINYAIKNNGAVKEAVAKYEDSLKKTYNSVWKNYRITGNV